MKILLTFHSFDRVEPATSVVDMRSRPIVMAQSSVVGWSSSSRDWFDQKDSSSKVYVDTHQQ